MSSTGCLRSKACKCGSELAYEGAKRTRPRMAVCHVAMSGRRTSTCVTVSWPEASPTPPTVVLTPGAGGGTTANCTRTAHAPPRRASAVNARPASRRTIRAGKSMISEAGASGSSVIVSRLSHSAQPMFCGARSPSQPSPQRLTTSSAAAPAAAACEALSVKRHAPRCTRMAAPA